MRVLFVVEWFFPRSGFVQSTYNIAMELKKLGNEITIITTDFDFKDFYVEDLEKSGVKLIKFKSVFSMFNFVYSPSMKQWLKRNLKNYDVIHMQNFRTYQNLVTHHYAKKFNKPYVLQAHGSLPASLNKSFFKKIFDFLFGKKLLKDASTLISLTDTETEQYLDMYVEKNDVKILPNGIDLSIFYNLPKKGLFKKKYSINNETKIVLYLGRIDRIKGLNLLINSFKEIYEDFNDLLLVIVGPENKYINNLKKLSFKLGINDKVLFTGPLYGEMKLEAYVDAYVYVLPSIYETFPMTVVESLSCNTPSIITDRCGLSDIFKQNDVGYVVGYEKTELVKALKSILSDEQLRENYSKNCRQVVEDNFSLRNSAKDLEFLYKNII